MNIISEVLNRKKQNGSCALIPFVTAGYPDIETSVRVLKILDDQGADIIELGIPYADALADGPVIQHSSQVALQQGVYFDQVLQILASIQGCLKAPIIIFTYYNPILARGITNFISVLASRGVKGLVVPDLPLEEIDYLLNICQHYSIELVLFVAPTSSEERINIILSKSLGCIYLVSSTGVTGTREFIDSKVRYLSNYIKSNTDKGIMIGFGISSPEQVKEISDWNIDGIVIGSAMIKAISADATLNNLQNYCHKVKTALN